MKLITMNVASIIPSEYNPPVRTDASACIDGLREDIKQRGLIEPLTIDKNNVLINGHRRFRCIIELNWKKVSVIQHNIEQKTTDDYFLATAADIVADPSAPGCFVNGIMEGREWVWNNGGLHESEVSAIKADIEKSYGTKDKEAQILKSFSKFMSKL